MEWYINFSWYNTVWGGNTVSDAITEKTGVNIRFRSPDGSESVTLDALIAGDNLPDLVTLGWWEPQLNEITDAGMAYALNELADEYDPYFWQVAKPENLNWYTREDGNAYCYPSSAYAPSDYTEENHVASNQTFLVRKDIYEALGCPDMTTPEGFYDAVRAAAEQFSTVDGEPLIPVGAHEFTERGYDSFDIFLQNFLAIPNERDGKRYDRYTDPEYKRWLLMFRQLGEDGLLRSDIFIGKRTQMEEKIAQGRYFCMLYQYTDMAEQQRALLANTPERAYIAVDGPRNAAGDPHALPGTSINGWTVTLISKNCDDPEKAIKLMSFFMSEEGQKLIMLGVEGENYTMENGKAVLTEQTKTLMESDYPAAEHIMSLVSPITEEGDMVGVVEVSVRMDEALPELFSEEPGNYSMLCTAEGEVPASQQEMSAPPLEAGITVQKLNGSRVLLNCTWLKEFNCWYVQVTNLSDLDAAVRGQAGLIFCALVVALVVLALVVSWLTKRLLRGFYVTFDGIRAFANVDVDATVEVAGAGEVADFAREANGLLNKIRQLMHDNLQREMQARESEIRVLQNQINAHFIYNVLEAIKMMAEIDERYDIADAVTSLGKLMRYSMKWESGNVSLERELDYIQNYIALMNLRFDYVVSLDIQIQPELLGQQLLKISLQPIFTLLWVMPYRWAISAMVSTCQYRRRKIIRVSFGRLPRNAFSTRPSSFASSSLSRLVSGMHSSISSVRATTSAFRLAARFQSAL